MTRFFLVFALALAALVRPALADDPSAVKNTIAAQLAAFRADDAVAAYAFASQAIKRMFPTAEKFADMVRRGYAPVYDARSPVFLRARSISQSEFAQEVGFTDSAGRAWTALYTLAKQEDGSWRITGC